MSGSDATSRTPVDDDSEEYTALFAYADDPMVAVRTDDHRPRIATVNGPFEETFGVDPQPGRPLTDLEYPNSGDVERHLLAGLREGCSRRDRVERTTPRGRRTFEISAVPARTETVDAFLTYRDVTTEVVRDQQLAVLRRVLRHDLRNDLTVVLGYARTVARTTDEQQTRDAVETVIDATDDLQRIAESADRLGAVTEGAEASTAYDLLTRIRRDVDAMRIHVDAPDGEATVDGRIEIAIRELCHTLVEDGTAERIDVDATCEDGRVTFRVGADGILSDQQCVALAGEEETPLRHASGIGPWLVRWAARTAGGTVDVTECGTELTDVSLAVPRLDGSAGAVVDDGNSASF